MSKWHHRSPWWSWLVSVLAVVGLGLATVPASAAPAHDGFSGFSERPAPKLDPSGMVAPQVVNINTRFGFNNAVGAGTGMVIDPGGVVLTNNHVISGATDISAFSVANGQTYAVDVVGYDRSQDVAVLQLRGGGGLPSAAIGGGASVGEPIVALGNTGGQGGAPSVMPGRVVALNQTVQCIGLPDRRRRNAERVDPGRRADQARRLGRPDCQQRRAGARDDHRRHR